MILNATDGALVARHDAILLDLDGVVYRGPDPVPGAVAALNAVRGVRLAYLTNNANRAPSAVADHLRELGLTVAEDDIVTSAQAIAGVMAQDLPPASVVFTVGGDGLRSALLERGLEPVDDRQDPRVAAVVQGYNPDIGWRDLAEAAYAVGAGLPWYVSNTDLTIPTAEGIAPGNGALVHAVQVATGRDPVVAGKPHAPLFEETKARIAAQSPLMVGDRLDTDIRGAKSAGIPSLWVSTGVNSVNDVIAAELPDRPDFVGVDLSALHDTHHAVVFEDRRVHCGSAIARVTDGRLHVTAQGPATDTLRALVALGWAYRAESTAPVTVDETIGS